MSVDGFGSGDPASGVSGAVQHGVLMYVDAYEAQIYGPGCAAADLAEIDPAALDLGPLLTAAEATIGGQIAARSQAVLGMSEVEALGWAVMLSRFERRRTIAAGEGAGEYLERLRVHVSAVPELATKAGV